jgi:beta-N-acetylhexosaminidase
MSFAPHTGEIHLIGDHMSYRPVVLDIAGLILSDEDRRRMAHPLVGGVILFARNFSTRAQLVMLTQSIRQIRGDILICIDHEGGRVQRARSDGLTHLPAMAEIGKIWNQDPMLGLRAAIACGYVLAAELRACGVDFSFTPVLDLDYQRSQVIGDRAFHADARVVTMLALGLTQGLSLAGMRHCGKHFPGHGYVEADSHIAIPVDSRTLSEILEQDVLPYRTLHLSLSAVMPAHVIYSRIDDRPAGFSSHWLQKILREQLGFHGVIFSDDLSMMGASVMGSVVDAGNAALKAGCDMILICNQPEQADALLNGLEDMPTCTAIASQQRIEQLRPQAFPYDWAVLQTQATYQDAQGLLRCLKLIA